MKDIDQIPTIHTASHRRWPQASHTSASRQQGLVSTMTFV